MFEHRHAGVVLEPDVVELDVAAEIGERRARGVLRVFARRIEDFVNPVEPRERLGDLRADRGDLHDGHGEQTGKEDVGEQVSERHRVVHDRPPADDDHDDPDRANHDARERRRRRDAGHRLGDVAEELVGALGEDQVLTPLGRVGLDDTNAAERLIQAAGDLRLNLAAVAEQRP